MQTVITDEGWTMGFCFAGDQTGHVFDPHIVVGIVWSFNQKQVDVMATVTFLADIQRNVAAVVASTQNVDAYGRVLFFELGNVFDWHREGEAGNV